MLDYGTMILQALGSGVMRHEDLFVYGVLGYAPLFNSQGGGADCIEPPRI
ncbi:hypothetical protein PAMC26510_11940 [Caballeronia sordidicola]|uniref:Uncharacterized protein n=1 Tax=Caballeronia sordidicola TaxID=196367 RepID=A0A242MXY7_CABSO|nr:hypothetical protein PAMC26510_11940 [Caballeronia sordidicola]